MGHPALCEQGATEWARSAASVTEIFPLPIMSTNFETVFDSGKSSSLCLFLAQAHDIPACRCHRPVAHGRGAWQIDSLREAVSERVQTLFTFSPSSFVPNPVTLKTKTLRNKLAVESLKAFQINLRPLLQESTEPYGALSIINYLYLLDDEA